MNLQKQFIAVRIDVGPCQHQCESRVRPIGLDSALVLKAIVDNLFKDRQIVLNYLQRIYQIPNGPVLDHLHGIINDLSEEIFYRICVIFPTFNPNAAEMIPVSDGNLDCIVYVELNEYTRAIIPPQYCQKTLDAIAVYHVARQYCY